MGIAAYSVFFVAISLTASCAIALVFDVQVNASQGEVLVLPSIARALTVAVAETVLFQLLPFVITRKIKLGPIFQFLAMYIPFALAHYSRGPSSIVNALFVGLILAMTFLVWGTESLGAAVFVVAAIHALHNGCVLILPILVG